MRGIKKKQKVALLWSGIISIVLAVILAGSFLTYSIIGTPSNYQGPTWYIAQVGILPTDVGGSSHYASKPYWAWINDTGVVGLTSPYHPSDCEFNAHLSPIFVKPNNKVSQIMDLANKIKETITKSTNSQISISYGDVAPEHVYNLKVKYYNSTSGNVKIEKIIAIYEFPAEAIFWAYCTAGGYNELNKYDIWIRINLNDLYQNWYWEYNNTPARNVYFAIGQVVATVKTSDNYATYYVNPNSGQALMLYYHLHGTPVSSQEIESKIWGQFNYSGGQLNPAIFARTVYVHIVLDGFGTHYASWWNHWGWNGDGVVIILHFHIFAVGEWVIQNVGNPHKAGAPINPPEPKGGYQGGIPGLGGLFGYFLAFGLGGVVALAAIIALVVMFPEIILFATMAVGKLKGGKGK